MKKEVIKVWATEVKMCFVSPYRYENLRIITYIHKIKWFFNLFTSYKVKQIIPFTDEPFYDGDYATNNRLTRVAKEQYEIARLEILNIKENKTKNYGKKR